MYILYVCIYVCLYGGAPSTGLPFQGVVTPIRSVDPSATRIKMKSRDQGVNLCSIKRSRNASKRRSSMLEGFFARILSDQGPFLSAIKRSR